MAKNYRKTDYACCDLCANYEICNDGKGRCEASDRRKGKDINGLPASNYCPADEYGSICGQVCMPAEKRQRSEHPGDGTVYGRQGQPEFKLKADKEWLTLFVL